MNRLFVFVVMIALVAGSAAHAQNKPAPSPVSDPALARLLAEIKSKDKGQLAVSEEDGRFMRVMIASSGAKRALEIGGASGYSAIWIGMGLRATGGRLVTIEYDPVRAKELAENVKRAGLDYWKHVDVQVWPDWSAFEKQLPRLGDPFFFSARATQSLWDASLQSKSGLVLIFGSESKGLPAELQERYRERVFRIPTLSTEVRSLNLSTSVGIVLYEVLRQREFEGR